MKTQARYVRVRGEEIPVTVEKKKVKKFTMRLDKRSGLPVVSAPARSTNAAIDSFINGCADWLEHHYRSRSFFSFPGELKDGDSVLFLGRQCVLKIKKGNKALLQIEDGSPVLYCRAPGDPAADARAYVRAIREMAASLFEGILDRYYPLISGTYPRPAITVKDVTSRWGSAAPSNGSINLSVYLMKVPVRCIESVVLHEVAHFFHMDHGEGFYRVVYSVMPDYDDRHRLLQEYAKL